MNHLSFLDDVNIDTKEQMIKDLLKCGHTANNISKIFKTDINTIHTLKACSPHQENQLSIPLNRNTVISLIKQQPNAKSHYLKKQLCPDARQSEFMTELNRLKIFYHNKSWCY